MHMTHRPLTIDEIAALSARGCTASDWGRVSVAEPFDPTHYRDVAFAGTIFLGKTDATISTHGRPHAQCGIYNASLSDVTVGDNVLIRNIGGIISRYDVGDNTVIENCGYITASGNSSFGLGTEVAVMVETGGREVPLCRRLSAPLAYLTASRRDNRALIEAIRDIIARDNSCSDSRGHIGDNVEITGVRRITDVNIGDGSRLTDCSMLANGTITGSDECPAIMGPDIIARDFVASAGCCVIDGVTLERVFVGEGVHLGNRFTAHDSLFFANSTCENGEACAVFAGPYTVTMHRSTLLIGGMFSFYNAGSGSNQSNHMYKLGPSHQGILARGSKTASDSYLLWPASIGAFSTVIGHVSSRPDTTSLPFSYIIESGGETFIVPGVALRSAGTARDADKWPGRDRRHMARPLDPINFEMLSPYTMGLAMDGLALLQNLRATKPDSRGYRCHGGCAITSSALEKGIRLYTLAIDLFMGKTVLSRLASSEAASAAEALLPDQDLPGSGRWCDLAGLIVPVEAVTALEDDIINGVLTSVDGINDRLNSLNDRYAAMQWNWVAYHFKRWHNLHLRALTPEDIRVIARRYEEHMRQFTSMLRDDAAKEFADPVTTGYGMMDSWSRRADFDSVHGTLAYSPFEEMLSRYMEHASGLCNAVIEKFAK